MIKVAQIINTHGLKGECKLYLVTDDPQHRFEKGRVLHLEDGRTLTVVRYREQKGFGYCYFEGVDSIEKAEQLKTKNLFIAQEDLPELEEGQYYYHELMHCTVSNSNKSFSLARFKILVVIKGSKYSGNNVNTDIFIVSLPFHEL